MPPSETPLRILLLCYEYPPLGGGGGIGASKYAEAWVAQGHEVAVITGGGRDLPSQESVRGVEVFRIGTIRKKERATSTLSFLASYVLFGAIFVLKNRGRFRSVQVINTHFSIPTGPLGWLASRLLGRPNVLTIIGGDIYDPTKTTSPHRFGSLRAVNRFLARRADRIVAISSDTKKRARELHGISDPIEVINYGFEPRAVQSLPVARDSDDRFQLVAVGRLVSRKGFDHLIQALAKLPDDVHLSIVGDGPLEPMLRQQARELGVAERLHLEGFLAAEEVDRKLRVSDCFVLSSIHEGLGIVVQEAMYAGLPIVSTNDGGQVDLLTEGRNALLVPPADPDALADAISKIRNNASLAQQMARQNQEDLKRLYLVENSKEYVDIFREVIGAAPPVVV